MGQLPRWFSTLIRLLSQVRVPPGNYVFEVKAVNNDGKWNETPTTLKITIRSPFWKSMYAVILYIVFLLVLFYSLQRELRLRNRLRNSILQERNQRENEEKLHQLKLQFFTNISHEFQNSTDIDFISAFYSENEIEMGIHEVITHTVVFHEPGIHLHHPSSAGVKNEKETKILVVEDNRELLDTATNIIEHHLVDLNSVDVLASELNLSRSSLHRKLKALTNQSATEFVKFVRINKSIKLIEGGETNIDEICFKVGFNSHSYYSMCFRKQLGQTPSDYISKIKEDRE